MRPLHPLHPFDRDTIAVKDKGELTLDISGGWSINETPNGGYIIALMTRAMDPAGTPEIDLENTSNEGASQTSCIVTANYLGRCAYEPAKILVETMGESRTYIRKQARLIQADREKIRAMATFVKPGDGSFITAYESRPETVAPWERCVKVPSMPGYSLFDQVDMRLDPSSAGWLDGKLSDRSVMKGWIQFRENRVVDLPAITLFADCLPPCVFTSRGMVAWVPTIEFSVNVRQLPVGRRLKGIFTTRFISGGLVEEDGEIWDEQGNLIALSRQIAKYHPIN